MDCQSELKLFCGNREYYFLKPFKIRQKRWNTRFGELLLFNTTSDCLETIWVSSWGSGLSIWIEIVLWKQGVSFLDPFKIKGRSGRMWDLESFYYLIQHQIVLKLLECHLGVVDCQSELNWSVKAGTFIFRAIQIHRQKTWNMKFGELLLFNTTSDCLETAWVSSWGIGLSIWIEIVLWKQGLLFLEPFKITDRTGRIWYLEGLYYGIKHQIVLKLLECHHGVVHCQSESKLVCGSRDFYF